MVGGDGGLGVPAIRVVPAHAALPFSLGVVVSETGDDLNRTVAFAREQGMVDLEVDAVWGTPVAEAVDDQLARARDVIAGAELRVSMIGAPTFKTLLVKDADPDDLPSIPGWEAQRTSLEGSFRAAKALHCGQVRVFSCRRDEMLDLGNPSPRYPDGGALPPERLEAVGAILADAARRAEDVGLILCLENVRSCFGNSGRNTARILTTVDHPRLRAIWDPANDFVSGGDGYPAGYAHVKPWLGHVHVKDVRIRDSATGLTSWEAVGEGELPYVDQFGALIADAFSGSVSLETHWHPAEHSREENSRVSFAGLLQAIGRVRQARA